MKNKKIQYLLVLLQPYLEISCTPPGTISSSSTPTLLGDILYPLQVQYHLVLLQPYLEISCTPSRQNIFQFYSNPTWIYPVPPPGTISSVLLQTYLEISCTASRYNIFQSYSNPTWRYHVPPPGIISSSSNPILPGDILYPLQVQYLLVLLQPIPGDILYPLQVEYLLVLLQPYLEISVPLQVQYLLVLPQPYLEISCTPSRQNIFQFYSNPTWRYPVPPPGRISSSSTPTLPGDILYRLQVQYHLVLLQPYLEISCTPSRYNIFQFYSNPISFISHTSSPSKELYFLFMYKYSFLNIDQNYGKL